MVPMSAIMRDLIQQNSDLGFDKDNSGHEKGGGHDRDSHDRGFDKDGGGHDRDTFDRHN